MSDKGKSDNRQILDGREGESVFTHIFMDVSRAHSDHLERRKLYDKIEKAGDERSYVLVTAMVVEHHLDKLLAIWMPGYKVLKDREGDFTFSMKTDLLKAFRLIPPHILDCVDRIREVRNRFAHNLNIDSIEQLDQSRQDKLRATYQDCYGKFGQSARGKSMKDLFKALGMIAELGLGFYQINIAMLRETMDSPTFINQLNAMTTERSDEWAAAVMSEGPLETEFQGDLVIERFREGVVRVSSKPSNSEGEVT